MIDYRYIKKFIRFGFVKNRIKQSIIENEIKLLSHSFEVIKIEN